MAVLYERARTSKAKGGTSRGDSGGEGSTASIIKVASFDVRSTMLPYKTTDGKVVLSMAECEWECNAPRKGNQQGGGHAEWVTCGLCKQEWKAERLLLHTAYHIAEDSNCTLNYPCGVCGVNSAAQYALDPSSVDGCPAYFVTSKGDLAQGKSKAPKFVVDCALHGQRTFSLATSSKSVKSNPGTSHLVRCPACPAVPIPAAFWSYAGNEPGNLRGMMRHWEDAHTILEMSAELKSEISLAGGEREQVRALSKKNGNRTSTGKRTQAPSAVRDTSTSEKTIEMETCDEEEVVDSDN